jgi:hypothetical protein
MIVLVAGAGAVVVVLMVAAISRRLRGTARQRHSDDLVEASEVSHWMSEVMGAMNPEPPTLVAAHDIADEPEPAITSTELAEVFALSPRALPTGPPRKVTTLVPYRHGSHFG